MHACMLMHVCECMSLLRCSEYVPEIQAKYADTMVAGWK